MRAQDEQLGRLLEGLKARGCFKGALVIAVSDHGERFDPDEGIVHGRTLLEPLIPVAHGARGDTTICELRMRHFEDGETVTVEPWRAKGFPVIKDCVVDRTALIGSWGVRGGLSEGDLHFPEATRRLAAR